MATANISKDLPPMEYVRLGNTGMKVSRLCLGCMSFGSSSWCSWVKDEEESIEFIKAAYEAGINFFDTANLYSNGNSERVLGKALKQLNVDRSRVVIATKVWGAVLKPDSQFALDDWNKDPSLVNGFGLSRKHIFDAVDASLERLGLNYIDLYIIHRFDPNTPIEETMEALNDLVRSGKVRYIGASGMKATQFQKMNYIAERRGWAQFVSMQNLYNLLYREEEREMIPYCLDAKIGLTPYSPLATGALTKGREQTRDTERSKSVMTSTRIYSKAQNEENNAVISERVAELAEKYKASAAQIALAWHFTKPYVSSPIIGCSKLDHLYDSIGALNIKLTEEDVKYLEEAYIPRSVVF